MGRNWSKSTKLGLICSKWSMLPRYVYAGPVWFKRSSSFLISLNRSLSVTTDSYRSKSAHTAQIGPDEHKSTQLNSNQSLQIRINLNKSKSVCCNLDRPISVEMDINHSKSVLIVLYSPVRQNRSNAVQIALNRFLASRSVNVT